METIPESSPSGLLQIKFNQVRAHNLKIYRYSKIIKLQASLNESQRKQPKIDLEIKDFRHWDYLKQSIKQLWIISLKIKDWIKKWAGKK